MTQKINKIKEKLNKLNESSYNLSDFNTISGKPFEAILRDNTGVPWDVNEKRKFVEKQEGFGGLGKVEFIRKKSTNEISAQIFSNGSTKIYVFKKLPNKKHKGMYNYACFVYIKPPKQTANNDQMNSSGGEGNNDDINIFNEDQYRYLNVIFEADENIDNDNKTPETEDKPEETPEKKKEDIEDTVYFLSAAFDDNKAKEKLDVLGDFIDSVNSMAL